MYLFVYEVSLRDRSYNRLRHRAFHGEAVPGDEKLNAKIPQLFVMNQKGGGRRLGHLSPLPGAAVGSYSNSISSSLAQTWPGSFTLRVSPVTLHSQSMEAG